MRGFPSWDGLRYPCGMRLAPTERTTFLTRVRTFVPQAEALGVPGAVLVVQAVLESGWGRSGLARLGHAWFGMKATSSWAGGVYSGRTREWIPGRGYVVIPGTHRVYPSRGAALAAGAFPGSFFRAYDDVADNVRDYLRFFHVNPRYHPALRTYARSGDPRRFALDIAAAGYATAPDYGRRLLGLMEQVAADLLPPGHGVWLDGRPVPAEALLVDQGRVYVRIRILAGLLGWRITYDHARKAVHVTPSHRSRVEEGQR